MRRAIAARSPSRTRDTSALGSAPASVLLSDDLGDARHALHDDALHAGLEGHGRHRTGAARTHEGHVYPALVVEFIEDDVAAVDLKGGTDGVNRLLHTLDHLFLRHGHRSSSTP